MSSSKRKPRTPSPLEDGDEVVSVLGEGGSSSPDVYAGRRVSVSKFESDELLQEYDNVASPGASSTSSEPSYVRQPGFDYHAHEVSTRATKTEKDSGVKGRGVLSKGTKKKKSSPPQDLNDGEITLTSIPLLSSTKLRVKREPLPMKLRALPQSFWVQPNKSNNLPPSGSLLPPLILGKDAQDFIEVRPITPPGEGTTSAGGVCGRYTTGSSTSPTAGGVCGRYTTSSSTSPTAGGVCGRYTTGSSTSPTAGGVCGRYTTGSSTSPTLSTSLHLHHSPSTPSLASFVSRSPSCSSLAPSAGHASPTTGLYLQPHHGGARTPPPHHGVARTPPPPTTSYERRGERFIKVGNTDLLLSLFDKVEQSAGSKGIGVRRGRPRRSSQISRLGREDDPCLVGPVSEGLLPLLPDSTPHSSGASTPLGVRQGHQVLEMVCLKDGDRTISLPSLNVDHNYTHILSQLVMKL